MNEHVFRYACRWPGGRNAVGRFECGALDMQASIPTGMAGPGVGTNPDELLLSAAAGCYLMTLAAMLERAELATSELTLASMLLVETERGRNVCRRIVHRPRVRLARGLDEAAGKKLRQLLSMADRHCMISNALKGNVDIVLEPDLDSDLGPGSDLDPGSDPQSDTDPGPA